MRMMPGAEAKVTARTMLRPDEPEIADDDDVEHHHREREQDVGDERDHLVPPAAEIAGGHAHQHADDVGDDGGERGPDRGPAASPRSGARGCRGPCGRCRAGRSRPWGSWPRSSGTGAIAWFGSCSGRIGARIAIVTQNSRMRRAQHADRALAQQRRRALKKLPEPRRRRGRLAVAVTVAMASAEPDARVEQRVADVGDELREHGHEHRDQRAGLDQVDVAEGGAVVEQLAEARDRRRTPRPRSRPRAAS